MKNIALRFLICMLLVCCLLINISPIRANATAAGTLLINGAAATATTFSAPLVILGIIVALGVYAVADQTGALDALVDSCTTALQKDGVIFGDTVDGWVADGKSYVDEKVVDGVRDYLIESKSLYISAPAVPLYSNLQFIYDTYSFSVVGAKAGLFLYAWHGNYYLALIIEGLDNYDDVYIVDNVSGESYRPYELTEEYDDDIFDFLSNSKPYINCVTSFRVIDSSLISFSHNYLFYDFGDCDCTTIREHIFDDFSYYPFYGSVSTTSSLSLGDIGYLDDSLAEAYPTWPATSSTSTVKPYPVSTDKTYDNALSQTQSEAQAGTAVITDTETDTDTGTGAVANSDAVTSTGLRGWLSDMLSVIVSWFSDILAAIKAIPFAFSQWFADVLDAIEAIPDAFSQWFSDVMAAIQAIPDAFADWFADILDAVVAIPEAFSDWFEGVLSNLESLATSLSGWFADVIEGISDVISGIGSLSDAIVSGISAVFVPSSDYLTAKVEALRENFGFIDSAIASGEYLRDNIFINPQEPVIEVDLRRADGDLYWGNSVSIDFAWYAPYKSYVDNVISAFLWAFFAWRVFIRLPGIISGESGYLSEVTSRRDSAGRKKEE